MNSLADTSNMVFNVSGIGASPISCPVRTLTANTTLTIADSGSIINIEPAAGTTITLPPISSSAGFYAKFNLHGGQAVVFTCGSADILMNAIATAGTRITNGTGTNLTCSANVGDGDWVSCVGTGTKYIFSCCTVINGAEFTIA